MVDGREPRGRAFTRSELRLLVLRALAGGGTAGLPKVATDMAALQFGPRAGALDAYLAGAWRRELDRVAELAANDLVRAGLVRLTPANDMRISAAGEAVLESMDARLAKAGPAGRGRMQKAVSDRMLCELSPEYRRWKDGGLEKMPRRKAEKTPAMSRGIVAAIDMLGAAEAWKTRDLIELQYLWWDLVTLARRVLRPEDGFSVTTASDTIMVAGGGGGRSTAALLKSFGMASWRIVAKSMQYDVPVRGCVAAGEYCTGLEKMVVGKAVDEAKEWHEQAKWIGIMAAPSAGTVLDRMEEYDAAGLDSIHEYYARYGVPLRTSRVAMWAVNWPRQCEATGEGGGAAGMGRIIGDSLRKPLDEAAARKWYNTKKFCDSVICGWDPYRKWRPP